MQILWLQTKQQKQQKITDMSILHLHIIWQHNIIYYFIRISENISIMPGHDVLERAVLFRGSKQSALICFKIDLGLVLSYW